MTLKIVLIIFKLFNLQLLCLYNLIQSLLRCITLYNIYKINHSTVHVQKNKRILLTHAQTHTTIKTWVRSQSVLCNHHQKRLNTNKNTIKNRVGGYTTNFYGSCKYIKYINLINSLIRPILYLILNWHIKLNFFILLIIFLICFFIF